MTQIDELNKWVIKSAPAKIFTQHPVTYEKFLAQGNVFSLLCTLIYPTSQWVKTDSIFYYPFASMAIEK